MAKRNVSPRLRFEVFKRDGFTCQYCGRTPPTVVLNCDHIHPVAEDGDNDQENLITACFECNSGKSDILLSQVIPSLQEQMADKKERQEQLNQYNDWLMQKRTRDIDTINEIGKYWYNCIEEEKDKFIFGKGRVPTIRKFIEKLPIASILDAIDIAMAKFTAYSNSDYKNWKYFCGICWNRIREENPDA